MMRSTILISLMLMANIAFNQSTVFSEDFEGATLSVSTYASSGSNSWALNTNLQQSGSKSDSAQVSLSDTLFLETDAFDATNLAFLTLDFYQICKIDFFDAGIIQVSGDNGQTWTQLTSNEYNGTGTLQQNAFSSISYPNWNVGQPTAVPDNSWWQQESFNISSVAGNSQVKVRFALIDKDNNGATGNYGWMVDDIEVIGAACELIPPSITLTGTVYQGKVYNTGPYDIDADITDASGIASATLDYTINSGSSNTLSMSNQAGNTYRATIPGASVDDTICYTITAVDNTTCGGNQSVSPTAGCTQFIVGLNPPPSCLGNPVFNFDYSETFATFIPGDGQNTGGTLQNNWENDNGDTHDWWVYDQSTRSGSTGPTADHSSTDANFLYVEASNPYFNRTAILNTPCFDLSNVGAATFSFWYHMNGTAMGDLSVDIYHGGQWINNITAPIVGNQGNQWTQRQISLSNYTGSIVKLRFRANTGPGFQSDIAIDDIEITVPVANELFLKEFVTPSISGCSGGANEYVTVKVMNNGSVAQNTIPLAYTLNSGSLIRDTAFVSLAPGDSINHTFQQTVDLSAAGNYDFDAWLELSNDGNKSNDSLKGYTVSSSSVTSTFPDTTNFDNFTVGVPGVFVDDWQNSNTDLYDWFVNSGTTTSPNTGPSGDNTSGLGNYVYVEATNSFNLSASLESKCYDISNLNSPELTFYYHMLGADMGDLHLDVNLNGIVIQDIMPVISGNQGSSWNMRTVDLNNYKGIVKLIFRGVTGPDYRSDIAIDDVSILDANPVGVTERESTAAEFNVFPNPANDFIWIETSTASQAQYVIRNTIGKVVYETQGNGNRLKIDVEQLSEGLYFIEKVEQDGSRAIKRFIIN